ncbi:hypothetical protein J415_04670 [Klebsiella michiganensis HKOPL1]|uniref:Uncharacterized protein n=1 Tax=Klebsiella michiganensis (strain ATCC 8724 / DSM 4798 / JCM 20051 / NBRC 3318 / NRRL B-199 / KCTC 1686 / BUCSAV 143 / CCM 1901) TaxID=1006551 RepID=A0A0H3H2T9_KLEM8|nr:hypothetical protein KOX_05085 [Klebsiella michiganensis KCTC 1686]AHW86491.1 hypothetical protein J415_04670 [Klebsiella michiganensis HKOPL1]
MRSRYFSVKRERYSAFFCNKFQPISMIFNKIIMHI